MYSDTGGDGPVVVLLHGVLMNGTLWEDVVDGLRDRYRCIVPELPFGAHTTPMPDDPDLSLPALATLIAEIFRRVKSQPRLMRPRRPVVRLPSCGLVWRAPSESTPAFRQRRGARDRSSGRRQRHRGCSPRSR